MRLFWFFLRLWASMLAGTYAIAAGLYALAGTAYHFEPGARLAWVAASAVGAGVNVVIRVRQERVARRRQAKNVP